KYTALMPRPRSLASLSLADLHRELSRRQKRHPALQRRRAALLKKLEAIDAELGDHAPRRGRPPGRTSVGRPRSPRAKNKSSLATALASALNGKTMSVAEAAEAVRKAGYKSNSPNFRLMVNVALLKKELFKRVGRGQYTAR